MTGTGRRSASGKAQQAAKVQYEMDTPPQATLEQVEAVGDLRTMLSRFKP